MPEALAGNEQSYDTKPERYFTGVRSDYLAQLPESQTAAILEIGCGTGDTGAAALAQKKCGQYIGIELDPGAAAKASEQLSEVITGNIETMDLPWSGPSFDCIIMSEVLEHLVDPWAVVAKLRPLLRPGGVFFASSPNISHYRVVSMLLRGRWDLTETGVMDRTHLRWFTPRTYREMFERAGYEVERIGPLTPSSPKIRLLNTLTFNRLQHLFWVQISVRAKA